MRTAKLSLAAILIGAFTTTPHAQNMQVTQTIQVAPDAGGMQFPPGFATGRPQFKTGSSRIRGRVLNADGSGPVRRAQVRAMSPESGPKVAVTDAQGRFDISELPAGRYTLSANKSGYVNVQYGQTRPFENGKPIELADKQILDADFAMPRGGAISGRVLDEFGDPLPDTAISVMRLAWSNGKRRLTQVPGRGWPTDDQGHYRVYGLPPGEYFVSARRGAETEFFSAMPDLVQGISVGFGPGFFGSGSNSGSSPKSGYATTYYPGTPNPGEAQKVTVAAAQESTNVDLQLTAIRLSTVTGFVMNSEGRPASGSTVTLVANARELGLGDSNSARTNQEGSFTFNNVAPGDYVLRAEAMQVITTTQGDNVMVFRATRIGGDSGAEMEGGSMPLVVSGEDVSGVTLITTKGARAAGRVIADGEPKPQMTAIRILSAPLDIPGGNAGLGGGTVKEDGTFELKGLFGTRTIIPTAPAGWTVRTVKLNGTDITDSGAEFKTGETYNLEVELTRRTTSITGGVTASDGSLIKDYTAVIFPENQDLWRLPRSRWVMGTRPDQDGRFKLSTMPPGSYYAVAVEYIPNGEWGDPEILDRLKSHAKRFTLDEGGAQILDLKLTDKY